MGMAGLATWDRNLVRSVIRIGSGTCLNSEIKYNGWELLWILEYKFKGNTGLKPWMVPEMNQYLDHILFLKILVLESLVYTFSLIFALACNRATKYRLIIGKNLSCFLLRYYLGFKTKKTRLASSSIPKNNGNFIWFRFYLFFFIDFVEKSYRFDFGFCFLLFLGIGDL